MSREHAPRPGVTWDRELVRREVYVGLGEMPTEATLAFSDALANRDGLPTSVDGMNEPVAPRLNREQRRALERAKRRKGGRR